MTAPLLTIALLSTSALSFLLGAWALLNAPRQELNRLFFFLCVSVTGWTAVVGAAEISFGRGIDRGLLSIGLGYFFGSLIPYFFFMVCRSFNPVRENSRLVPIVVLSACATCVYLGFTGQIVEKLSITSKASYYSFSISWGFFLFIVYVVGTAVISANEIFVSYRKSTNRFVRLQLLYFSFGAAVSFIAAILFNLLLPAFGIAYLSPLGALSPILAICTIFFAITEHRLFNLDIPLKYSTTIGAWCLLLLVPTLFFIASPDAPRLDSSFTRILVFTGMSSWALVLYGILRRNERSFVSLGGERGYVHRNALDSLSRSLVGVANSSDVMVIASNYLRENHGVQDALLWHRLETGDYQLVKGHLPSISLQKYAEYFETLDIPHRHPQTLVPGAENYVELAEPPSELRIRALVILPRIAPGTLFMSLMGKPASVKLDRIDLELIASFSYYTAAALKGSIQMEQIEQLNVVLSEAQAVASSYNTALEQEVQQATNSLSAQLHNYMLFSETLVHDISNEVNAVIHDLHPDETHLAVARSQLMHLLSTLRNVSQYLTPNEIGLPFSVCDVNDLASEILQENMRMVVEKGIDVELSSLPQVYSHPYSLRQILCIALMNSMKYVGDKSSARIVLTSNRTSSHVAIRIRDNGIGIPPREVSKVFNPLYRGSRQTVARRPVSGTGMGLAIAKRLAHAIGGELVLTSQEGVGTEVTVLIPFYQIC